MSKLTEEWERLDDGTRNLRELANLLGCKTSTIVHLRQNWYARHENGKHEQRCRRCDFFPDEKVPFVKDDLCLWCWLTEQGIDLRDFYESGAWKEYITWRPGDSNPISQITKELRSRVNEKMNKLNHTVTEAAKIAGCARNTWRYFLTEPTYNVGQVTAEASARYLGIEPNARGVANEFHMHPRVVAIVIRGW